MSGKTGKRWLITGIGALTLLLAVGLILWLVVFRDTTTEVAGEEVGGSTLVTGGGQPGDFGVYRYATTGYETTDALTGSRHDYPAETFITIQPGGCGTLVRWQPLEERWDEWDYCPDGSLAGRRTFHEWFQIANLDLWACSPPVPTRGEPGAVLTGTCGREETGNAAAAQDSLRFEVIGYETLTVGAAAVETLHVRMTGTGTGGTASTRTYDTWLLPGTYLIVRQTLELTSNTQSRVGLVHAEEQYEISLISLQPGS